MTTTPRSTEPEYFDWVTRLEAEFNEAAEPGRIFVSSATDLFDLYLSGFPLRDRQYHNCNTCRHFIERYGRLVTINEDGDIVPLYWRAVPPKDYVKPVAKILNALETSSIASVFADSSRVWGTRRTGHWSHFALRPNSALVHTDRVKTPFQVSAEKREDHTMVTEALNQYREEHVETALSLIRANQLYRGEQVERPAQWLLDLKQSIKKNKHNKVNLIWRAVATAPPGFAHVRSSMLGTLLDDIAEGLSTAVIAERFAKKMNPLQYQRPTAPPTIGNLVQAEKLVEKLGIENSLKRKFATLSDIATWVWTPTPDKKEPKLRVFGSLAPAERSSPKRRLAAQNMTWHKFSRDVLPNAISMEIQVPSSSGAYATLLTAADASAPNILQWDNTVSWFYRSGGMLASALGLAGGQTVPLAGITKYPSQWSGLRANEKTGLFFMLSGVRMHPGSYGSGLFPEILKSDLHAVRASIEAYSRTHQAERPDGAYAVGLGFKDPDISIVLDVHTETTVQKIHIDRFE